MTGVSSPFSEIWSKCAKKVDLDKINRRSTHTLVEHLGITIDEILPNGLKGSMPVDDRTVQPYRMLHGGASCVLAESLGSIASNIIALENDMIAVGQGINTQHLRPASEGRVYAIASFIHLGARSHVWNIDIFDENNKIVSTSRLTMAIIKRN